MQTEIVTHGPYSTSSTRLAFQNDVQKLFKAPNAAVNTFDPLNLLRSSKIRENQLDSHCTSFHKCCCWSCSMIVLPRHNRKSLVNVPQHISIGLKTDPTSAFSLHMHFCRMFFSHVRAIVLVFFLVRSKRANTWYVDLALVIAMQNVFVCYSGAVAMLHWHHFHFDPFLSAALLISFTFLSMNRWFAGWDNIDRI